MPKFQTRFLLLSWVFVILSPLQSSIADTDWSVNILITDDQGEPRSVFCEGATVKLTATHTCNTKGTESYSWSPGGSTVNPLTLSVLPAGNYTYTITVTIGNESRAASAGFTVLKVEITPSEMNATESLDSGTFTCTVTPSGLNPTYQWLTGSANNAWPATAGNNPELDYSASTASSTIVNETRWFAPTPERRQAVDGAACCYNVNCEVTVGGVQCRASTPATLTVTVNMTAQTTRPMFQNWNSITVAQDTNGVWNVTGQGTFSRSAPIPSVNVPATSQFHYKLMVHENKHVTQWTSEAPWKDLFDANALYNSTLSALTSTNSEADLRDKILAAVLTQATTDDAVANATMCDREAGAFAAGNAVDPDFLELDDADWKPLYGCQ